MGSVGMETREKKWTVRYPEGNADADRQAERLAAELGCSFVTAKLLLNRNLRTADEANRFLRLEETHFHDSFGMLDMDKAVSRIESALAHGERIAIYGDYDVDGVTSTGLLYLYLQSRGGDVSYYIPSRLHEGYGLSKGAIDRLAKNGVQLMITVDTGITAVEETAYAKTLGIETVVTDHHTCRETLPDVCAAVNPHRPNDPYPFKDLAGVGVVFKLVSAMEILRARDRGESDAAAVSRVCHAYADLVAIGTVADVMPLVDENRLLVCYGLSRINREPRLGIAALIEAAKGKGRAPRHVNSTFIGFGIAPRMNAAGRMGDASIAVDLILSEDAERAKAVAESLCNLNSERQAEENRIAEAAYRRIETSDDSEGCRVLVLDADDWHQGIIGIVSSRITERYGLPSILVTYDGSPDADGSGSDVGKGSGRSIKGLNLVEALAACSELLVRYGGHELAAGLSVRRADVPELRRRLNAYAAERLTDEMLCVSLEADCVAEMSDLNEKLVEETERLEPFGTANPAPTFVLKNARLRRLSAIGGGKHLRMLVVKDGITLSAVWFGVSLGALNFDTEEPVDLLFRLGLNDYMGNVSLQMTVLDMRASSDEQERFAREKQRYAQIEAGGTFLREEDLFPSREAFGTVWRLLRRESLAGKEGFSVRRLQRLLNQAGAERFSYCKLMWILRVFRELELLTFSEPVPDRLILTLCASGGQKKDLERSSLLCELKKKMRETPEEET